MITRLSLKYGDGFTSDLISFKAILSNDRLIVDGSWFDPDSNNTNTEFYYVNNIERLKSEVAGYVSLNENYQFPTTDLHSVTVKFEYLGIQYSRFFYGIGPSLINEFPELTGKTIALERVISEICQIIAINKGKCV